MTSPTAKQTVTVVIMLGMRKRNISVILSLLLLTIIVACQDKGKGLPDYALLDRELSQAAAYDKEKVKTIDDLRRQFMTADRAADAHSLAVSLAAEYRSFINDSALYYLRQALDQAKRMGNRRLIANDHLLMANQYIYASYHREGQLELAQINRSDIDSTNIESYYTAHHHLYQYLANDLQGRQRDSLLQLSNSYLDSLFSLSNLTMLTLYREQCEQYCMMGVYDKADSVCQRWESITERYSRNYAILSYYEAEVARGKADGNSRRYWLIESAISDIRHSVKHQMALWTLAEQLTADGDYNRPYKYVLHSWECAQLFNAQGLTWIISPVFTSINDNYNHRLQAANQKLFILTITISLLVIGLAVSYVLVRRKNTQLATARAHLAETNSLLEEFNTKLTKSNLQLGEANRLKEEYIGQFFSMCSEYIDKLDKYRIKVNRKLKASQNAELLKMTASEQLRDDEYKELLANFDKIFTNIFPNFVERFNALLQPDSRIHIAPSQPLSPTLRIFALIRLGIEESSRIAEFLNYPPGTIYNYRNRIKNKALCDRSEFEERVKSIGMD